MSYKGTTRLVYFGVGDIQMFDQKWDIKKVYISIDIIVKLISTLAGNARMSKKSTAPPHFIRIGLTHAIESNMIQ